MPIEMRKADFSERHTICVAASVVRSLEVVRTLDFRDAWLTRTLFGLRGLPVPSAMTLEGLARLGFIPLDTGASNEIALGLVGRFWTFRGDLQCLDSAGFVGFSKPGFVKVVWSFRVDEEGPHASRITTETRICCLDVSSRRRFRIYWSLIGPFSALVRTDILHSLRRRAEALPLSEA